MNLTAMYGNTVYASGRRNEVSTYNRPALSLIHLQHFPNNNNRLEGAQVWFRWKVRELD